MSKRSTSAIPAEERPITQADIARGRLVLKKRKDGRVVPVKQRVNIYLDQAIVDHFKRIAGRRGYQTLINEALRETLRREDLEVTLRRVLREELKGGGRRRVAVAGSP